MRTAGLLHGLKESIEVEVVREHLGDAERAEVGGVVVLADADERPAEFAAGADIPRGVADVGDAVEGFAADAWRRGRARLA